MFAPFVLTHKFLFIYSFIQQTFVQCLRHTRFRIFLTFYLFILLYNIVLVLPYINMNPPRVYTCSPSWTPLPPPSPYHPSGSSQCTSPKLPVSCIKPGLVIHFLYDIIHVLMPFSQIIQPSLSHRVQKTVVYICVSFAGWLRFKSEHCENTLSMYVCEFIHSELCCRMICQVCFFKQPLMSVILGYSS